MAKGKYRGLSLKGADDVYLTERSIAVRRVSQSFGKNGLWKMTDKTTYYPKTKENLSRAYKVLGRIRTGRV